jgi:hypothetical protein
MPGFSVATFKELPIMTTKTKQLYITKQRYKAKISLYNSNGLPWGYRQMESAVCADLVLYNNDGEDGMIINIDNEHLINILKISNVDIYKDFSRRVQEKIIDTAVDVYIHEIEIERDSGNLFYDMESEW